MTNLLTQAVQMKSKFVSREMWDETPIISRHQIIFDVLGDTSGGSPIELFSKTYKMILDNNVWSITDKSRTGWYQSYDEMIMLFDLAIRLAKLQVIA